MRPDEYYRLKSAQITDAEVRLVAAVMSDYVGEENAVRLERLAARVGMDERKVRIILNRLVIEYGLPVCAHSGKAGRWLATTYDGAKQTQAEYYSRSKEDKARGDAYNTCYYPPEEHAKQIEKIQPALLDVPEPDPTPYWRW